jgi:ubiquinone biosynthesis protein UbiJ
MPHVTTHRWRYLLTNWLDVLIVLCSGLAVAGAGSGWVALVRLLRKDMHADVRHLRTEVATLIGDEERALRSQMHADIRDLREEVKRLRDELDGLRRAADREA